MSTRRGEPGTNYRGPDCEYVARVMILIRSASPPLLGEGGGQKFFYLDLKLLSVAMEVVFSSETS